MNVENQNLVYFAIKNFFLLLSIDFEGSATSDPIHFILAEIKLVVEWDV